MSARKPKNIGRALALSLPMALVAGVASADYNDTQLRTLNKLIKNSDTAGLVVFWNDNISSHSKGSEVEDLLADLMHDIRQNGEGGISKRLRQASDSSISRPDVGTASTSSGGNVQSSVKSSWRAPYEPIFAALR